ncbi:alpha/beta fold hydrolase [Actinomadura luteofluorescens]|uniref:alpha/beta fold hydrolase n=1 Tax=Actinomadura luteofluorescens TaxID=46163 RepID=UPI0036363F40
MAGAALVPALTVTALAGPGDTTSPVEKARADRVPTPKLDWYKCYDTAECATVRLPLDYDDPKGATTEIAVLRVRARNAKKRIGSLFVNPGGPGGQGTAIAYQAPYFLGKDVLDRFDIVGFDPRGIGFSSNVACFKSTKDQTLALAGMNVAFPVGAKQEAAYVKSAKAVGKGCSTTGKKLAGAMSTAEAARDMDVLRRAVGDKKLSYLGFSYGTAIGQYYANMFPDRLRAVVVDGVINPVSWAHPQDREPDPGRPAAVRRRRLQGAAGDPRPLRQGGQEEVPVRGLRGSRQELRRPRQAVEGEARRHRRRDGHLRRPCRRCPRRAVRPERL